MEIMPERGERILVCISSSPSNQKVIEAAAKMAVAFRAVLTAIYVKPSDFESLPEADKKRLQENFQFAEENGAAVTTVIGNDIPSLIAEYAHISGTTKIVVGRSGAKRQHFWSGPSLTEQLIISAPDVDIYIIPDSAVDLVYHNARIRRVDRMRPTWRDLLMTLLLLAAATGVGLIFTTFGFSESNIITVYILGVLITSIVTISPVTSAVSSLASVFLFNYFFIEPKFSFHTYEAEYLVTFAIMLTASLITGTLANKLKDSARHSAHEAFRAKVLFDTNQLLQKAVSRDEVISITAGQVTALLDRDVMIYPAEGAALGKGRIFRTPHSDGTTVFYDEDEEKMAEWAFLHQQTAGTDTERSGGTRARYHAICINGRCYGVLGVQFDGKSFETFENSVLVSIIGECALALDSLRNAEEREQAAIVARNEKLRSNLLRSISHDIRTPLTTISGNASNLLSHYTQLNDEERKQIFSDIYSDSRWLTDLVENLLSISRIENGSIDLHMSLDVVNDVIDEALRHIDRNSGYHSITIKRSSELLLARMDSGLITQVLINLINNAVKNTQADSEISIISEKLDGAVAISVCDNGPGIADDVKRHVFEMFYTGKNKIADGRRGVGLGLALCKSIVEAHGGEITLTDNIPTGCRFTFTIPCEEVKINE